jgi:tetratricopeptide (TPR) repeat protein
LNQVGLSAMFNMPDEKAIRRASGELVFERGQSYKRDGRIIRLDVLPQGGLQAIVRGQEDYQVSVSLSGERMSSSCTCPAADTQLMCKHAVAALLACMEGTVGSADPLPASIPIGIDHIESRKEVEEYVSSLSAKELRELVLGQAAANGPLRRHLQAASKGRQEPRFDPGPLRSALEKAILHSGFIDYHEADGYAAGVHEVIDELEATLAYGEAKAVKRLCEEALDLWEQSWDGGIDDSDGQMGEIQGRLIDVHLNACMKSRPDPIELAGLLFERAMRSDWEVFLTAAIDYADVLGERGLAEYRRLAEAAWSRVPALGPGEKEKSHESRRFRITHIMESIIAQTGTLGDLVDVRARDLSVPYEFLRITNLYAEAGDSDRAIEWAERGIATFPKHHDTRLSDRLADLYESQGRHHDAMALVWKPFLAHPDLERYQEVKRHAELHGQWQAVYPQAMEHIRGFHARAPAAQGQNPDGGPLGSGLVRVSADTPLGRRVRGGVESSAGRRLPPDVLVAAGRATR